MLIKIHGLARVIVGVEGFGFLQDSEAEWAIRRLLKINHTG